MLLATWSWCWQVFQCFITALAFYEATEIHVEGKARVDPKKGKGTYYRDFVFMSSDDPKKKMRREAHINMVRQALAAADYSKNGQVTHRPRHQTAVDLRVVFSLPVAELAAAGGWDGTTKLSDYAQLPCQDVLAKLAGFGARMYYLVTHTLLDPGQMEEFSAMVAAFYPGVEDDLQWMQQVRPQT